MKINVKVVLLVALQSLTLSNSVHSAEVFGYPSVKDAKNAVIAIYGPIEEGDEERVRDKFTELHSEGRVVSNVYLYSPGGLVSEALGIGALLRKAAVKTSGPMGELKVVGGEPAAYRWCSAGAIGKKGRLVSNSSGLKAEQNAIVDSNCICASACALIWLGGVERDGEVAFHRSYFQTVPDDMSFKEFSEGLGVSHEAILDYMQEMRTPDRIADIMIATPSTDLYTVRWHELWTLGLDTDRLFAEFLSARCKDPFSKGEWEVYRDLDSNDLIGQTWNEAKERFEPATRSLSKSERVLLQDMRGQIDDWTSCKDDAKLKARQEAQLN